MNWQTLIDPQVSSRVCLALLHSVWQVALLSLLVRGFDRLWQRRSAQGSYIANVLALLLAFIVVPVTYVSVSGSQVSQSPISGPVANKTPVAESVAVKASTAADEHHAVMPIELPPLNSDIHWDHAEVDEPVASSGIRAEAKSAIRFSWSTLAPWIVLLYVLGVVWMLVRLAVSVVKANRLVDDSTLVNSGPLFDALQSIVSKWSMRVTPALAIADRVIMPKVIGVFRPVILFPVSAISGLSADELRMILTHELAHVRRHDMWINLLQRLAEAALFFNPAIWYLSRRISTLREYRCDEITCQEIASEMGTADLGADKGDPQEQYALALLHVVELLPQHSLDQPTTALAAGGRSPSELRRRVARLFGDPLPEPVRISRGGMLMIVTALVLLLAGPLVWNFRSDESDVSAKARVTKQDESHGAHATEHREVGAKPVDGEPIKPKEKSATKPAKVNERAEKMAKDQKVTISGRILLEDGSPAKVKGHILFRSHVEIGEHASNVTASTKGPFTDRFSFEATAGTTWLVYDTEDYAPAWIGPLETRGGDKLDNLKIVLKQGFSEVVKVVDERGEPIAEATLIANPVINGNRSGFSRKRKTDTNGEYLLEHIADTEYQFTVTGSGFQPLRTEPLETKRGETLTLAMKRAQPTTGVILNADGTPAASAKLRARYEKAPEPPSYGFGSGGDGFWGEVLATADDQGRFKLASLNAGSYYLFVVETADKARLIVRDLQAGQSDVKIVVPKRRDLIVTLNGDLANMQQRKGKPFLSVRQKIHFAPEGSGENYFDLVGADAAIELTETGGVAIFKGLAHDGKPQTKQQQAQVLINNLSKVRPRPVYDLNPTGDTRITIDLPEESTAAKKTMGRTGEAAKTDTNDSEERVTISGRIVMEDGSPAKVKGQLFSRTRMHENGGAMVSVGVRHADRFSFNAYAGTTTLAYFVEGYAPTWLEPFDLAPDEKKDNITLVLKKGFSERVKVSNEKGEPVVGATVIAHPEIEGYPGHRFDSEQVTDTKGEVLLHHLAKTQYTLRITKPGYQPLQTAPLRVEEGDVLRPTMILSRTGTGVVRFADGTPAPGSKLRLVYEQHDNKEFRHTDILVESWGKIVATADDRGRFKLDQLADDGHYLFVVEAVDGTRAVVRGLKAGQKDFQIVLPRRRDLVVKINGDLSQIRKRGEKYFARILQTIQLEIAPRHNYVTWIGDEVVIDPTATGGEAIFRGLAVDLEPNPKTQQVEVRLGSYRSKLRRLSKYTETANLNSSGGTRVEFDLAEDASAAKKKIDGTAEAAKTEINDSEERVTISGRIVLEDGSPATVKGRFHYSTKHGHSTDGAGLDAKQADRFTLTTRAGTTRLTYYVKGYAPTWLEPFDLAPGEKKDNITLVLEKGFAERVKLTNEKGEPVPGATIVTHSEINGFAEGPVFKHVTDSQGEVLLEHLANTQYVLKINKPGYQPLQTAALRVEEGEVLRPTMIRSRPGTGVVRFADGTPAPGSKLRLVYEYQGDKGVSHTTSRDGGWGKIVATADVQGRFELDQLADDGRYLFVVEAVDGTRALVHDLQAGNENAQVVLPRRRDLFIKVKGDLLKLHQRQGRPVAMVRQRIDFQISRRKSYATWIRDEVALEQTDGGGEAIFRGLAVDLNPKTEKHPIQVTLAGRERRYRKDVNMNSTGGTRVEFDLAEDSSTVKNDSKTIYELKPEKKPFVANGRLEYPNSKVKQNTKNKAEIKKGAIHVHVTVEDGSRATTAVWIWHKTDVDKGFTIVGGGDKFRDQVLFRSPPGKTWLYCFTPGYAPAWDGPFDVEPGVTIWGGDIVLKRGFSAPVKVVDEQGQPIEGATLVANPQFDDVSVTPALPDHQKTTDVHGEVVLTHLAETPYTFTVRKPGYQLLRSGAFNMRSGELVTLAMIPGGSGSEPKKDVASSTRSNDDFKDAETAPWQVLTLDIHHFLKTLKENQTGPLLSEAEMSARLTTLLQLWRRLLVMENKYRSYASWLRPDSNTQDYGQGNYAHVKLDRANHHMSFDYWRFVGHQYKEREYLAAAQELLFRINTPEGVGAFLKDLDERGAEFAFAELRQNTATSKKQTTRPPHFPMTQREFVVMNRNLRGLSYLGRMHYLEERPFRSVKNYLQANGENHPADFFEDVKVHSTQSVQPAGWNVRLTLDGKERWFVVPRGGEVFEQTGKPLVTNEASQPAKPTQ